MIPATWRPYRRAEDDELLGYLRPVDDLAERFVPVTVFGYPLGNEADEHDAQHVLDSVGLSYLADRWLLTLDEHPDPISVEIVEASPTPSFAAHNAQCRARLAFISVRQAALPAVPGADLEGTSRSWRR